jgi:ketosteroid isomerase-like protein
MSSVDIVKEIYRNFMAGNAAGILARFADDVEFRLAEGHPYRGRDAAWIGKNAVVQKFFAIAGAEWGGWSIAVDEMIEAGDAVIVEGRYAGTYKPTGRSMDLQVCHVWRFRGDAVASFHQYVDTARLQGVMRANAGVA